MDSFHISAKVLLWRSHFSWCSAPNVPGKKFGGEMTTSVCSCWILFTIIATSFLHQMQHRLERCHLERKPSNSSMRYTCQRSLDVLNGNDSLISYLMAALDCFLSLLVSGCVPVYDGVC